MSYQKRSNSSFSVFKNTKTLMSYQAGYHFGMNYFIRLPLVISEKILPNVLNSLNIPLTKYNREGYEVGIIEAFLVVRHMKSSNMLLLNNEQLTEERKELMGLLQQAKEQAIKETSFPFLKPTGLKKCGMSFCVLTIGEKSGMEAGQKQWTLEVVIKPSPTKIAQYNKWIEETETEKVEQKKIQENGKGIITISKGARTRDRTIELLKEGMKKTKGYAHSCFFEIVANTNRTRKAFYDLIEVEEKRCACSYYSKEQLAPSSEGEIQGEEIPEGYDPFIDEDTGIPEDTTSSTGDDFEPFLDGDDMP